MIVNELFLQLDDVETLILSLLRQKDFPAFSPQHTDPTDLHLEMVCSTEIKPD